MATMYPELSEVALAAHKSRAEADAYRAFRDQLPSSVLVLHSLRMVRITPSGNAVDGEADFVIFDQHAGVTVVEVKGGGVRVDPRLGTWTSVDRNGSEWKVKNPFLQALESKKEIMRELTAHSRWRTAVRGRVTFGHCALFPSLRDPQLKGLVTAESPRAITGGKRELEGLKAWLGSVSDYWAGPDDVALGQAGMRIAQELYFRPIDVRPPLGAQLQVEEEERIRLTENQSTVLRAIRNRRQALVAGGAGTGKSLLAIDRARELAAEGSKTLYVCYNRALADYLRVEATEHAKLSVLSFHQLCHEIVKVADRKNGSDLMRDARDAYPASNRFDVQMPFALMLAIEQVQDRFDAIVVDEGQDFGQEYWAPIMDLLRDESEGRLLIFYDPNQAVYGRDFTPPINDDAFLLTKNCRNTKSIHVAAYAYYMGETVDPPTIEGEAPKTIVAGSAEAQAQKIHSLVTDLISKQELAPSDIAVLLASSDKDAFYRLLEGRSLPGNAKYLREYRSANGVLLDTVKRFKGLETPVLILWGLDDTSPQRDKGTLYVGLSRAKARLWLVGTGAACSRVLGPSVATFERESGS